MVGLRFLISALLSIETFLISTLRSIFQTDIEIQLKNTLNKQKTKVINWQKAKFWKYELVGYCSCILHFSQLIQYPSSIRPRVINICPGRTLLDEIITSSPERLDKINHCRVVTCMKQRKCIKGQVPRPELWFSLQPKGNNAPKFMHVYTKISLQAFVNWAE